MFPEEFFPHMTFDDADAAGLRALETFEKYGWHRARKYAASQGHIEIVERVVQSDGEEWIH